MFENKKTSKKLLIIVIVLVLLLAGFFAIIWSLNLQKIEKQPDKKEVVQTNYPSDFKLKEGEIPEEFKIEKLDKSKMNRLGLKSNPGTIYSTDYYRYLYSGVKPKKVDQVYTSILKHSSRDDELGVLAIKYKTPEDLDGEEGTIKKDEMTRKVYLRSDQVLVIIWCDDQKDIASINKIADKFKQRLKLQEL